jgi:hydroxymethylpyrimidine/phosphomethylpyrimidine kinase
MGAGIIPDLKALDAAHVTGAHAALTQATVALSLAVQAEGMRDINEVQPWASVIAQHLKAALDALGG